MLSKNDIQIISHLRNNARKKVTEISKQMKMPATTIYDKIKSHQRKGIVKRHVALLDFSKLGYNSSAILALKVSAEQRKQLQEYLESHPNVNSLYKVNFDHDFVAECVFKDTGNLQDFIEETESKFTIKNSKVFSIVKEIKKEGFLSSSLLP